MGPAMKPYLLSASAVAVILALAALVVRATGWLNVDLESQRLSESPEELPSGIIYQLPEAVVDVEVEATIEACGVVKLKRPTEQELDRELLAFEVDISVNYTMRPRARPDPTATFNIPLNTLRGVLWSTATTIELNTGSVKSINARSTAAKIESPGRTVAGEARLQRAEVQALSQGGAAAKLTEEEVTCGLTVMRAIERRAELKERLAQQTDETSKMALLTEIGEQQAKLSRLSQAVIIPRLGKAETMWLRVDLAELFQTGPGMLRDALEQNAVTFAVSGQWPSTAPISAIGDNTKGVVYRVPVLAKVVACRGRCSIDKTTGQLATGQIVEKESEWFSAPQLGREARLPVTMVPFSDRHLEAAFSPYGALERIGLSEKTDVPGGVLVPGKTQDNGPVDRTGRVEPTARDSAGRPR